MLCENVIDGGKIRFMSITSFNDQKPHPDFADLLSRHSGLAGWLLNTLQNEEMPRAEGLMLSFLAECASQGISRDSYPFTREDQGLADLQAYLQNAQGEIDAFANSSLPRRVEPLPPDTQGETDSEEHPAPHMAALIERSTEKRPAIQVSASSENTVPQKGDETISNVEISTKVAEYETAPMPATTLASLGVETVEPEANKANVVEIETTPLAVPAAARAEDTDKMPPVAATGSRARGKKARTRPRRTRRQRILAWALLLAILGNPPGTRGFSDQLWRQCLYNLQPVKQPGPQRCQPTAGCEKYLL